MMANMKFVNRICPNCKNPNYMVLLYMDSIEDYSRVYKYKCLNCHKYFNDDDFKEEPPAKEGENVTKAFKYLNWYFTQDDGAADKNAVKAWEALIREWEAVEPINHLDMWLCGSCRYAIPRTVNYCPKCGRKVKWK